MSDNKKYYYLKLKENFFDSEEIKVLESMENGYKYSNILLKMYLKSLKREGLLVFKDTIPYDVKMIATVTDHNVNDVKQALVLFQQMGLIEILSNGAIYMMDIQNFIGKSSTEADRVRAYRNQVQEKKQELLESENPGDISNLEGDVTNVVTNVQQKNDISTPELEIELELEKEKPSEKSDSQSGDQFSISKKENGRYNYPEDFEKIYSLYPSQRGSKKAHWRKWAATRRKGVPQKDLETAAKNYAAECQKNGTDEKYIKQFKTFYGRDEHWREYIGPADNFDQEAEKQKRLEKMRKKQEEWVENYG